MNKKWFLLIGVVVLIVTVLVGCAQPAPTPAPKPAPTPAPTPAPAPVAITLKFSTWMPAAKGHPDYEKAERMFAEMTKRTNGQLKFNMFASEQLAAQKDHADGIKSGLFDVATYMASTTPAKTPLWTINWQPWALTNSVTVMLQAMRDMSKDPVYQKELDQWGALYFSTCGGGPRITMSKKPVNTLDDFKGLKVRASGREAEAYQIFGANPVAVPTADVYDAISKGTIDATTQPYINLVSYGIPEVAKYVYDINLGMGSPIFIISKDVFNKLPPNIQKIVMDVAVEDDIIHGQKIDQQIKDEMAKGKQAGKQTFVTASPAEQKRYDDAVADKIMGGWIKEMNDKGLPGQAAFDAFKKAQEKYKK